METMLVKRNSLTDQQKILYSLVCAKLKEDEPITFPDIKEIWLKHVCGQVRDGVPYYFNYYAEVSNDGKEFKGGYMEMNEYMIKMRVTQWLTMNIGSLVVKGYLKIIPQILII